MFDCIKKCAGFRDPHRNKNRFGLLRTLLTIPFYHIQDITFHYISEFFAICCIVYISFTLSALLSRISPIRCNACFFLRHTVIVATCSRTAISSHVQPMM